MSDVKGIAIEESHSSCRCGGYNDNCHHCFGSGVMKSAFNLDLSCIPRSRSRTKSRYFVPVKREEKNNLPDSPLSESRSSLFHQPSVWSRSKMVEQDLTRKQMVGDFIFSSLRRKKVKKKTLKNWNDY